MKNSLQLIFSCVVVFICSDSNFAEAQTYSQSTALKTVNSFHDDTLMKQHWWIELDLLLNPIYVSQFSSKYSLNGHKLKTSFNPHFYGILPDQNPFSNLAEILDQSNAIYWNFRVKAFEQSKLKAFHNTRLMVGITHDKLETGSKDFYYKFSEGGTELTVLLDKNISHKLSDLDFRMVNLIFSFNIQGGLFASLANIRANLSMPDSTIESTDNKRWIWQNKSFYLSGWGWLVTANFEVGGALCHNYFIGRRFTQNTWLGQNLFSFFRHVGFTVGTRASMEGLYTSPRVSVNGVPGYRLRVHNYGIFFVGPVINVKWMNF